MTISANTLNIDFANIPPGPFMMGLDTTPEDAAARFCGAPDWYVHEQPRHRVTVTRNFFLSTTQITRAQFCLFVEATGFSTQAETENDAHIWTGHKFERMPNHSWRNPGFGQTDTHPAVCISHDDALAFCAWLTQKENRRHRLPTEAEWEYAYRAGTKGAYTWGNDLAAGQGHANAADQTAKHKYPDWTTFPWSDGYIHTAPVASFKPNAWGLFDMAGNVWEWCADWFSPYTADDAIDPLGPATGDKRILRGGSWYGAPLSCRAAYRSRVKPDYRGSNAGFRIAIDL